MRGVVPQELTLRLPFLQAAALVLVSGRNGLSANGASDDESTPERPTANNESTPNPVMNLVNPEITSGSDIEEASLLRDTLATWVSPDVISTITTQDAAPSGAKRTHSTVEEEPQIKMPRFDTPHDLPCSSTAALSCEDRSIEAFAALEGPATTSIDWHCNAIEPDQHPVQAEIIDTAQEHDYWATLSAWLAELPVGEAIFIKSTGRDTGLRDILGQQAAFSTEPTHASYERTSTDATAPALEPIDAKQQFYKPVKRDTPSGVDVQDMQLPALGAASIDCTEQQETPKSSWQVMGEAPTHDGVSSIMSSSGRSRRAPEEGRFTIYNAARKLLRSPEGANHIKRWSARGMRTTTNIKMANAPYLSSSWLMERLLLHDRVPVYLLELQTALECFGYDNVTISDLLRKALDLAYTLWRMNKAHVSNPSLRKKTICLTWAVELVQDALLSGRSVRPDLKSYLRNKLKIQNVGRLQLPDLPDNQLRKRRNMRKLQTDFRRIKRAMKPRALTSHPLDFTTFFSDVFHLVTTGHLSRRRIAVERSTAVTGTKLKDATKSQNVNADARKATAIVTKYKTLFKIDLVVEVKALLKAPPAKNGDHLFNSAVEDGYVPFDLLRPESVSGVYGLGVHCLLGSITALYRRLFENTNETRDPEVQGEQERSGLDGSDASNERSELDVVQEYLLQPLSTPTKVNRLIVEKFNLLSAASETLALWNQDPKPVLITPLCNVPKDLIPFNHTSAPFGTPQWILTQMMHECRPEEHQEYRNELYFVFDLLGYPLVDIKQVFAKALVLAEAIMAKHVVPIRDPMVHLKLSKTSQVYVLAADIIHATFFHTWPQRRDLVEYFAKQLRYEVLPQHEECLREVMAKREEWHPHKAVRTQKGDKEVIRDWMNILTAKKWSKGGLEDDHPLSFDRFFDDARVITKGRSPAIPAIASKYKLLFDRNIVEDLKSIRTHSPQIRYNESFVKGIKEGYVPYRYAKWLTFTTNTGLAINNNASSLLGAYVDYFMSLVGSAEDAEMCTRRDTAVFQQNAVATRFPSEDEVDQTCHQTRRLPRPGKEERRAQLMAILERAPQQKRFTAEKATTKPSKLHPVAQYLLRSS